MVGIPAKNVGTADSEFKPYAYDPEVDKETQINEKYSRQILFQGLVTLL